MSNLATDDNNDIFKGPDGNLAMVVGIADTEQACEHAMKAQRREIPLALSRGVPTDETVWSKWKPLQFEAAARALLVTLPHVSAVKQFSITRAGDVAKYATTIQTDFGTLTVQGIIA